LIRINNSLLIQKLHQMQISLIQSLLHWENVSLNLEMFEEKMADIGKTDLIILPEMFSTGFSMNALELAEKMDGQSVKWIKEQAEKKNAAITGSLIIEENGHFYNRLIFMLPDGNFYKYDKKHLFSMAKEEETFTAGTEKLIIEYLGWKICPFVCYDLRFPVWNRNKEDYDLAIYVANWPDRRSYHWRSLLVARAIENQCYIAAVNRVGTDGKGLYYSGYSSIIDPAGEILYQQQDLEDIQSFILSKKDLEDIRTKLPFLKDRD
jgi:predicted amidohydrolase